MEELIKKIELILIIAGQHDNQFRLGEVIKYSPSEVRNILMVHISELEEVAKVQNGNMWEGFICAVTGLPCCGCSACCEHRKVKSELND